MFKSVIFDLDGTLLNTLEDLHDAVNYTLNYFSLATRKLSETRKFVGNGVKNLILRALPEDKKDMVDIALPVFKEYYGAHKAVKTAPYSGIIEMLEVLSQKGIKSAIVSNKYDLAVKELQRSTFDGLIDYALGEKEGLKRKPEPDSVFYAMEQIGAQKESCVFVGDSETDILTAKNAGLKCIAVTWGFRDEEELIALNPDMVARTPKELEKLILDN